jgi:hypothetical protein
MKKFIFILTGCTLFFLLPAQNPSFQWVKQMGETSNDFSNSVKIDASGNVYTSGYFNGTVDFDPGPGTYTLTSAGAYDIYISKLDASGNFICAKQMGSTGWDFGSYIELDPSGNLYTIGIFQGTVDFDPGPGSYTLASAGCYDVFISKLDSLGNFIWTKSLGGSLDDYGHSIAIDPKGYVYLTGTYFGTADFDPGAGICNLTSAGNCDIFILKLDASGNFVWAKSMGGAFEDHAQSIALNNNGSVYTAGGFRGTADFDPGPGAFNLVSSGNSDIFISKLDVAGNFVWAKKFGGVNEDFAYAIALDAYGNAYGSGYYSETADFDPGPAVSNLTSAGSYDIFILKVDASGNYVWAKSMGGPSEDVAFAITLDASANIYLAGHFCETADFDPGPGTFAMSSAGSYDIFSAKIDASGNFIWAKSMGGPGNDKANSIAIDALSGVYTTGGFNLTADFDPGPGIYNLTSLGSNDIFIHKMGISPPIVGMGILTGNTALKIFPNPNSGLFEVEFNAKSKIIISNSSGRIVHHEDLSEGKNSVNLQKLSDGIYFIKAISDNQQQVFKIIKE